MIFKVRLRRGTTVRLLSQFPNERCAQFWDRLDWRNWRQPYLVDWNAADWMAISTGQQMYAHSLSLSHTFSALDIDNSLIFRLLSEHSICYAQHFVTVAVALFESVTHHSVSLSY